MKEATLSYQRRLAEPLKKLELGGFAQQLFRQTTFIASPLPAEQVDVRALGRRRIGIGGRLAARVRAREAFFKKQIVGTLCRF